MRNLKRALSLALASVMLMGMMVVGSSAASYPDVDTQDHVEAIEVLSAVGVIVGDNGNFRPDDSVSRNEMAVIMAKLILGTYEADSYVGNHPFTDVPSWADRYVAACYNSGIIAGRSETTYDGTATVTAVEAAAMMLRALGYEDLSKGAAQWDQPVAAKANAIALFEGMSGNSQTPMTRNDVAKLALNSLEATMVVTEKEGDIEIPGTIVIPGKVTYKDVTSRSNDMATAINGEKGTDDNTFSVELGEKLYNGDLKKFIDSPDDFGRPSTKWFYKGDLVISVSNKADATYTKRVSVGDIYKDLGLNSTVYSRYVTVYVDGVQDDDAPARDIKKGDTENKYGGKGVLTEVYRDDNGNITITEINTWTGEIARSVDATGSRDAYVVVTTDANARPDGTSAKEEFETDEAFDDDTRVIYTYSQREECIVELAAAEAATGTVTKTENANTDDSDRVALSLDDNRYEASKNNCGTEITKDMLKKDYTIYLDFYGYMIYVEEGELNISDYALLIGATSGSTFTEDRARLLFTDGTIKNVKTDKSYNGLGKYTIVTFSEKDGEYALTEVNKASSFRNDEIINTNANNELAVGDYNQFELENNKAGIVVDKTAKSYSGAFTDSNNNGTGDPATFLANSASTFVVADPGKNGTDSDFSAYTGIKEVPTVKSINNGDGDNVGVKNGVSAFWYCKNGSMITVMFIFPGSAVDVDNGSDQFIFISKSAGNLSSDKNNKEYYEYNAVVGGEVREDVMVDGKVEIDKTNNFAGTTYYPAMDTSTTANTKSNLVGLFKGYSEKDGVITGLKTYTDYTNGKSESILTGVGIDKTNENKNYTLIMGNKAGGKATITAADDCQYFYVDKDGGIIEWSYKAIRTDENDQVYAMVKDWMVKILVIVEVPNQDNAVYNLPGVAGVQWKVGNGALGADGDGATAKAGQTVQLKLADTSMKPTLSPAQSLTDKGNGVYEFTMPAEDITSVTLTSKSAYDGKIVFSKNNTTVTAKWTGAVKPTDDELCDAMIDYLVSLGYPKKMMNTLTITAGTSISVKATKMTSGVAGTEETLTLTYAGGGLKELREVSDPSKLADALTNADEVKLNCNAEVTTAPSIPVEVASGKTLTLGTGVTSLTQNITGAGSVEVKDNLASGGEKIAVTGGISVAAGKTLTLGATAITCDITGEGKVSTAAAITNGDKIKVAGGLTLGASSSIDKIGNIDVTVTGATSISGVAAPKSLTHTAGKITVGSTGSLTLPAITLAADGMEINGTVTLNGDLTLNGSAKNVDIKATGVLDLNSKELKGVASATVGVTVGAQIKNISGTKFFASNGDAITGNITVAGSTTTYTWGNNYGTGTNETGWKADA